MQVYILQVDDPIAPFGEPARDAVVGGLTLTDLCDQTLARLGLQARRVPALDAVPPAAGPTLLLREDLFVTHRALRSFLRRARARAGTWRLALPDSLLMQRYHPLQRLARADDGSYLFDLVYHDGEGGGGRSMAEAWAQARPLQPEFKERRLEVAIPRNIIAMERLEHPLTTTVAMRLRHWIHILWANNLMPQIRLVEQITGRPLATLWRLATSLGLSRAAVVDRLRRRFCYRGRRCRIHPTARVEYSILGDDVEIGAYTLVRGALIGRGTVIEDRANVCFSSIAPGSFVSRNSTLIMCAGYPDADLCTNGIQFSLAGRRAALTSFVRQLDMRHDAPVTVRDGGEVVELPGHMLGGCYGHRVFVGPDVTILPGREIPNGAVLLPSPGDLLARVPAGWPEGRAGVVRAGELVPLRDEP